MREANGEDMSKVLAARRKRRPVIRRGDKCGSVGVWVRLPKSVVEARAGLVPSEELDVNPPPDGLTGKELLTWHRGQPVFLSARRFVECLGTAKLSRWRQALPFAVTIAPSRISENRLNRAN